MSTKGIKMYKLYIASLLCLVPPLVATPTTMHFVPSDAKPGYIITVFSQSESQRSQLQSTDILNIKKYFGVLQHGAVITTGNLTSLEGQTISITILHELFHHKWTEQLRVKITNTVPRIYFKHNLFRGYILENQPKGTEINGLDDLSNNLAQFPYGCIFKLHSGDTGYFKLKRNHIKGIHIVSQLAFDREAKHTFFLTIQAQCHGQIELYTRVRINIVDLNDAAPVFEQASYTVKHDKVTLTTGIPFYQVKAVDADSKDVVTYSMSNTDNGPFAIKPSDGSIYATDTSLLENKVYNFVLYAADTTGHRSAPATIEIKIYHEETNNKEIKFKSRVRRQSVEVLDERVFVVNENDDNEDLFSVASFPPIPEERFAFDDPEPEGLTIGAESGLVSREADHVWTSDVESFDVIVTRENDPEYNETLPVLINVVNRSWTTAVFTTQPQPLQSTVPIWIRPDTTIFTLTAVDEQEYGCDVWYRLETEGDGRFKIDPSSGQIMVADRGQFYLNDTFELGISGQCIGAEAALSRNTHSQQVTVKVDDAIPQFYFSPYIVNVPETTTESTVVATIEVKSFQDLDINLEIVWNDQDDGNYFSLNPVTGELTLLQSLVYITDKHQFRATITATEDRSFLVNTEQLIINLSPQNMHTPYFPPEVYIQMGVSEDVSTDYDILYLFAIDLDLGELGLMDFTTSNDLFRVDSNDGKSGVLRANNTLDYDFLGPEHKYEFTVYATDQDPYNPKTGSVIVQVYMENVDDEPPYVSPPNPHIWLKEGADAGSLVHVVQAFDPDGGIVSFRFTGGGLCEDSFTETECDIFVLDSSTGHITLNTAVPIGKLDGSLFVTLQDTSGATTDAEIVVEFVGINHPPRFPECGSYSDLAIINEAEPTYTEIINITVIDDDSGSNGEVVISVLPEAHDTYFDIDQVDDKIGTLIALRSFDREETLPGAVIIDGDIKYKVNVIAQDQGRPPLSTTCFFFVTIQDINNNFPIFDETVRYEVTIPHSTELQTEIMRVWAIDDDKGENGRVTYSLDDPNDHCSGCFDIDENSGWISVANNIPGSVESVILRANATDNGVEPRRRSINVVITMIDQVQNLPPVWQEIEGGRIDDYAGFEVLENSTINDVVTTVTAILEEGDEKVQYNIARGRTRQENSDLDFFYDDVEENSMLVYVATSNLEAGEVPEYLLKLRASRQRGTSEPYTDARLIVKIIDVNDKVPQFEGLDSLGRYSTAISDQTRLNDLILNVVAIDLDVEPPYNEVTYTFDESCSIDCDDFTIDSISGEIFAAKDGYDREDKAEYLLVVQAEDGAPSANRDDGQHNRATAIVAIIVLGPSLNPPEFDADIYQIDTEEGQEIFTSIINVTANDPDPESNYPQYMITNGQTSAYRSPFTVDGPTGNIYLTADLLYSEAQSHVLNYGVFDGSSYKNTSVIINVTSINIEPPFFEQPMYNVSGVTEHDNTISPQNPRELTTVRATDGESSTITYEVDGELSASFSINQTGTVFLEQPLDRDYPDGFDNWQINVVAWDTHDTADPRDGYAILNLYLTDINDNSPRWDISTIDGSIPEHSTSDRTRAIYETCNDNRDAGDHVMQIVAIDVDAGVNGRVEYQLYYSPTNEDGAPLFEMDQSGIVTVGVGGDSLDREVQDNYELTVGAHDLGNPTLYAENQTVYIAITDINDHPPIFTQPSYEIDMPEEIPVGGYVCDVTATDEDIGENAKLTFNIVGSGEGDSFYFDSIYVVKTGAIKINTIVDYDEMTDYQLTFSIEVSDPGFTASSTVTINVLDINDNAPEFSPDTVEVSFPEDTAPVYHVTTLSATDRDSGINGEFYYMIDHENTDPERQFGLDPPDGNAPEAVVVLRKEVDREVVARYDLHVLAVDRGDPPLTGTATVVVLLEDVNDHAPDFAENENHFVVSADAVSGQEVARFHGSDLDTFENGPPFVFDWLCNEGEPCEDFEFTKEQDGNGSDIGVVTAARDGYSRNELGFDAYFISIRMTDTPQSGQPSLNELRTLTLTVESTNENEMSAGKKGVFAYTYKGMFDDVACGNVYVEDQDDWDLPDKTFQCIDGCEGPDFTYFTVEENEGEIFMQRGTPVGPTVLQVQVHDQQWNQDVISEVAVNVFYVDDDALYRTGSVRFSGITAEGFIRRNETASGFDQSKAELFRDTMAALLNVQPENVELLAIVNVMDVPSAPGVEPVEMIDVTLAAHGGVLYYSPARLNGLIMANIDQIESVLAGSVRVEMSPVNLCLQETCFGLPCHTEKTIYFDSTLANTNQTSYAGINITYEAVCEERLSVGGDIEPIECEAYSCLNGGACIPSHHGWTCDCTEGYDGPRCQNTKISFQDNSWGWFDPIDQMVNGRISFEFATTDANGVLLYNGPTTSVDRQDGVSDYLVIFLEDGYANAHINLGSGTVNLTVNTDTERLNDGIWHSIEIMKQYQLLRLVVDHCASAVVDENINTTSEDRSSCEDTGIVTGDNYLLNILTPLELGGQSSPGHGPSGIPNNNNFQGCIKGLRVNDKIYDLNIETTESVGLANGCALEGCYVDDVAQCSANSTCIGNLNDDDVDCVCDLGWRGTQCDEETLELDFLSNNSYIEWALKSEFNQTLSDYDLTIAALFITREENGLIFTAASFSRLEHIKVDILDTHPRLRYDLGSGEYDLIMSGVNVSDGAWHKVYVERHGNHLWFAVDQGEGVYFKESLPIEEHRLLAVHDTEQTFGGADVYYRKYHEDNPTVANVLVDSCVSDIRLKGDWLPVIAGENNDSPAAFVEASVETQDICETDACAGVVCPDVQYCVDIWRMPYCVCPYGQTWSGSECVDILDCSIPRCNGNGYCVVPDGTWYCHCYTGWSGADCSVEGTVVGADSAALATSSIATIVACLLILLILILIVLCFVKKQQERDFPEDEIRENIISYDEEGGGEEDMHAYDLSNLQKEVVGDAGMVSSYASRRDAALHLTAAGTDMHARELSNLQRQGEDALNGTSAYDSRQDMALHFSSAGNGQVQSLENRQDNVSNSGQMTGYSSRHVTMHMSSGASRPISTSRKYNRADYANIGEFIGYRLRDADGDMNLLSYDSVREYEYEGEGSTAGSLSSIQSSASGDLDFTYLNSFGGQFQMLAELYGVDDDNSSV